MSITSFYTTPKIQVNTRRVHMHDGPIDFDALFGDEFSDLIESADDACWDMLDQTRLVKIDANRILFNEAVESNYLMLIVKGCVRVYKESPEGRKVMLYRVKSGQLCMHNLNILVSGLDYPITARTETDLVGLTITRPVFHKAIADSNSFRNYMFRTLTERLSHLVDPIYSIAFDRVDYRIAGWLNQRFEKNCGMPITVTHKELAQELGITREMVSSTLEELECAHCIQLKHGCIHLQCRHTLILIGEGKSTSV